MNLLSADRVRILIEAENVNESPAHAALELPDTNDTTILGRVTQAHTGNALAGLMVVVLAGDDSCHATRLGRAAADLNGRFEITLAGARAASKPLRYISIQVETADGGVLLTSEEIALDRSSIEVALEVPVAKERVAASAWATLGRHLQAARIGHLNRAVHLLQSTASIGVDESHELDPLVRQAMLHQLEQAFLDPTGALGEAAGYVPSLRELHDPERAQAYAREVLSRDESARIKTALADMVGKGASFASLAEVDWQFDPALLENGNVGGAVDRFKQQYVSGDFEKVPFVVTDLNGYRDYLLAVWTTVAMETETTPNSGVHLSASQARTQLTTRFHQNFATLDQKPRVANAVLAQVLIAILTAPGKAFGFGVAAAAITAQGTRTPREYLDFLIALSGQSRKELGFRYRLDLTRPDTELSSPVQENIATLQGFFRDTFQCDLEPKHVEPDVLDQPIVPDKRLGKAPFFLYFDEWLQQEAPFYPENHLDIRRVLPIDVGPNGRRVLGELVIGNCIRQNKALQVEKDLYVIQWKFCQGVVAIWDKLQAGHTRFYAGEYALASVEYRVAEKLAKALMESGELQKLNLNAAFNQRKNRPMRTIDDLPSFMESDRVTDGAFDQGDTPDNTLEDMGLRLAYYALFTIPICLADAEYGAGDFDNATFHYGQATRFKVGVAHERDVAGGWIYSHGDNPFTVLLHGPDAPDNAPYPVAIRARFDSPSDRVDEFAVKWNRRIPNLSEIRFCRLRQANVMLDWADALYRTDNLTNMARARELYKGVLWLHGKIPPICPTWPLLFIGGGSGTELKPRTVPTYAHETENPALVSQTMRASRGIYQIDNHLNYYGERDDIVPMLRYRPLKNAADRAAAMARGAQQDFLHYTERVESAIKTRLQLSNFMQKAKLQSSIAGEQKAIADHDVVVAQDQVAAVQAAIKAKLDDIANHDSLMGQIGDAFKSVKSIYDSVPDNTKSAVSSPVDAGVDNIGKTETKEMAGKGMLGLGEAGSIMTGFGMFAVVGYVTLTGLKDAADQRTADLHTLLDKALPAALAAVEARKHGVAITRYQQLIAEADLGLAETLLGFEENQVLNQNFWLQLSQVARRLLRRYLEMGARIGWLAERALAYEQDRAIRIMRMDYFPARLQGVTGADLMQADLAELDATRIEAMKRTMPVRRTLSLARDFPLAYGQLKTTGRCAFRTEEAFFRRAYPGTFAYRVRAISTAVQQAEFTQPLRGSLINRGVSVSKPKMPGEHVLVRPSESLPVSEFRLDRDMAVYGLPSEALLTFEGSNIETFWELGFPRAANANGLDGLLDVLLTFDLFCEFAPERYETDLVALPGVERKWILLSAAHSQPAAISQLAGSATSVEFAFDVQGLRLLPQQETARRIRNVAAFVVTPSKLDFNAQLKAAVPAITVAVAFKGGFAMSSLDPDPALPPLPASPLNALADVDPDQRFTVAINKAANPGVDFQQVTDVVLALEYEATLKAI